MINWFLTTRDLNSMLTSTTRDTLCGIFFFLEHWQNNETPRHMKCVRKKTQNQILDHSALWLTELTTRIARACCTWWSKCLLRRRADVFGSKDLTSKKSRPTNMSLECGGGGILAKNVTFFCPENNIQYSNCVGCLEQHLFILKRNGQKYSSSLKRSQLSLLFVRTMRTWILIQFVNTSDRSKVKMGHILFVFPHLWPLLRAIWSKTQVIKQVFEFIWQAVK